ncbi:alpha/beta hydrolase [Phenylobacterium sp.]|jgi:pimeloyl-ACP methyl ester carboxylesterase|uniref:alpha/beta fold hydrolase n=1 Tax=Phenylobacterium sp. TaxID=1871053 RepID=UPI0025DDED8F|nr:alpha/beta hydrolase [Phenylobacterium sp.]MCA6286463.1 alpha/beta hydrolase [Phenylobacterium sp.]MCA6309248.1 alpha/beta hydrolase [Phenylobacterium sp.]MCA6322902.1 alpha/beta hydrolase [Phenylobacterium sp.]MCA6336809.1 alpha/beta hydrolase [Phenylobacterium sp.]MCA6339298.1 alpha/beta hydrolase [Phenylobacterium sp.]
MALKPLAVLAAALIAATLAGCARDIPYETLKAKYANPTSKFVTLENGVNVHYRDQGRADGPPLVLVHGFAANLDTWEPWVARLGDTYRVVSLDLPAHGLTVTPPGYMMSTAGQVEVIDQLTRKLGLTPFVLAGNSMGGGASWNFALSHPDRLRGLILVASVGPRPPESEGAPPREGPPAIFQVMANPVGRAALRSLNPRPLAEPGLRRAYIDESLVTPALVDRYVDLALAPGRREMILAGRQGRPSASPDAVKGVSTPTLVMHGEKDVVVPPEVGRRLAELIPGARLVIYPEAGHVPMEQIPDRSAADVRAFIESLPASEASQK